MTRLKYSETSVCSVDGCDSRPRGKGLCLKHYTRLRKHGDVNYVTPSKWDGQECSIGGCRERADSRGWCVEHYSRWWRTGDPCSVDGRKNRKPDFDSCTIAGCEKKHAAKGLCADHYARNRKYGDPCAPSRRPFTGQTCQVADCDKVQSSKGYCDTHYKAARRSSYSESDWHIHRIKNAARAASRRARAKGLRVGEYDWSDVLLRMAYWGNKCWMCGGPFEHVDHVKPLAEGGKDCLANFRPACAKCNASKGAKWYGNRELHRFVKS